MTTKTKTRRSRGGSASIIVLRPLLAFLRTEGADASGILEAIGVRSSKLDDYDLRITEERREQAWTMAAASLNDVHFGLHVAEHAPMGTYDALDYSLYFSTTLGEAVGHLVRFYRVVCDAWALQLDADAKNTRLRRVLTTPAPEAEFFFALILLRARALTDMNLTPREVRFAHAAPADTKPHTTMFGAPVHFGCATSQLTFRTKDFALPVKTANLGVERVLKRYLSEIIERLPKNDTFVERVRAVVAKALPNGRPTLHTTARQLSASPRTVQRRLAEGGTSHVDVVSSVRRELAERLVAEGRVSITEIAFLLGFADVTGFARVYKRWTGIAPSESRKQLSRQRSA